MPPRAFTNPPPLTESAREARKAFSCALCGKGYARQNEFAAHEASYDHQHRQRLKDLKAMNKSMDASASRARRVEEQSAGVIKITPIALGGAKSGKKGGFKSAFAKIEARSVPEADGKSVNPLKQEVRKETSVEEETREQVESEDEDDYERYNPRKPTECPPHCRSRHAQAVG